ncbi:MAG TPA: hypothetical protein VIH99_02290 [Bdellovibrionota bacterium]|jgi:hypothetical protein
MFVAAQCLATPIESTDGSRSPARSNLPDGGLLPEGSLIEISGPEARIQAARILAENRGLPAAWIEQNLEALPDEVFRSKMDFKKTLFINGRRDSTWAISSLLRSRLFPLIVYYAPYENEKFLRRLRRQARQSGATVLLLREEPCFSWTIRVQLRALQGKLDVLRWRNQ